MSKQEKQEYMMHVENLYDTLVNIQEQRGISYGEIAYVESLKKKELEEYENELEIRGVSYTDRYLNKATVREQ